MTPVAREEAEDGLGVLLGEDRRRRHQRRLVAAGRPPGAPSGRRRSSSRSRRRPGGGAPSGARTAGRRRSRGSPASAPPSAETGGSTRAFAGARRPPRSAGAGRLARSRRRRARATWNSRNSSKHEPPQVRRRPLLPGGRVGGAARASREVGLAERLDERRQAQLAGRPPFGRRSGRRGAASSRARATSRRRTRGGRPGSER